MYDVAQNNKKEQKYILFVSEKKIKPFLKPACPWVTEKPLKLILGSCPKAMAS